jgi:hypothetical protein
LLGYDYSGAGNLPMIYPYLLGTLELWPELKAFLLESIAAELQPTDLFYDILESGTSTFARARGPLPSTLDGGHARS